MHPVERAGSLDMPLRRLLYNPTRILKPWIREGMTVLDFGCGPGFFARAAAELVGPNGKVIAVDLQEGMLALLRKRIAGGPLEGQIEPHLCTPERLGVTEKVDLVYAFYVMHEVPDRERVLHECCALLRPGGRIFVMESVVTMSRTSFEAMERQIEDEGCSTIARPRHFLSRSAVCEMKT